MKLFVKYFVAILTGDIALLNKTIKLLEKKFGPADLVGPWHDFTFTDFYEPEMGPCLKRCIVSFEELRPPAHLPKAKKWTAVIEDKFRDGGKRRVNIDAGYMDFCKVVLVSGKIGGHKIALSDKCFADMILDFSKGSWHPLPWCFPDFGKGTYNKELIEMRKILRKSSLP